MKKIILSLILILSVTACDKKEQTPPNEKPAVENGVMLPLSGNGMLPITARKDILYICLAKDSKIVDEKTNFLNWQVPTITAQRLIEVLQSKNAKKIVLFTSVMPSNEVSADNIKTTLTQNNIELVKQFRFNNDNLDKDNLSLTKVLNKARALQDVDYWILQYDASAAVYIDNEATDVETKNMNSDYHYSKF